MVHDGWTYRGADHRGFAFRQRTYNAMMLNALNAPASDPTSLFELSRAHYASDLLNAAVHHLKVFELLAGQPLTLAEVRQRLGLAERPAQVLFTALRAF